MDGVYLSRSVSSGAGQLVSFGGLIFIQLLIAVEGLLPQTYWIFSSSGKSGGISKKKTRLFFFFRINMFE